MDKILQTKKAMRSIIKTKEKTRIEKYNLVKEKRDDLSKFEQEILLKECRRDYESYDRVKEIKDLITIYLTGVGMFVTIFGIFFSDKIINLSQFSSILTMVGIAVIISVLVVYYIQSWSSNNLCITKYMIDILEDK